MYKGKYTLVCVCMGILCASVRACRFLRSNISTGAAPIVRAFSEARNSFDGPVMLGAFNFSSRTSFIASGGRCRTNDSSAHYRTELEQPSLHRRNLFLDYFRVHQDSSEQKVKIHFHIVTSTTKEGDASDDVIDKQMKVLNRAYRNTGFSFELSGVTRTQNNDWFRCTLQSTQLAAMKQALRQGSYSDLNVYTTVQPDSTLGWATLPDRQGPDIHEDGIVLDYRTLPGGEFYPYNEGQTLTHETGHWLGLQHTFFRGCIEDPHDGDFVVDTPAVKEANYGCPPASTDSCPGNSGGLAGNDLVHNYMDFVDDSCMREFTPGQVRRMHSEFRLYRMV